jgi:hypothetical protein
MNTETLATGWPVSESVTMPPTDPFWPKTERGEKRRRRKM